MQDHVFKLKPSKFYVSSMLMILLVSMLILLLSPLSMGIKLTSLVVLILYGGYILTRYGLLRHQQAVVGVRRTSDGRWYIQTQTHAYLAELCDDSTVTGLISILRFRTHESFWKKSCVILPDSLEQPDYYRKLLVILRMRV